MLVPSPCCPAPRPKPRSCHLDPKNRTPSFPPTPVQHAGAVPAPRGLGFSGRQLSGARPVGLGPQPRSAAWQPCRSLDQAHLDASTKPVTSHGDGGAGGGAGNGGSGGDGWAGDDGEESFLGLPEAEQLAAAKGISLPADFVAVAAAGGLRASSLEHYAALLKGNPFTAWLARTVPAFRDRLIADRMFLFKVLAEVAIDTGALLLLGNRGWVGGSSSGRGIWGRWESNGRGLATDHRRPRRRRGRWGERHSTLLFVILCLKSGWDEVQVAPCLHSRPSNHMALLPSPLPVDTRLRDRGRGPQARLRVLGRV